MLDTITKIEQSQAELAHRLALIHAFQTRGGTIEWKSEELAHWKMAHPDDLPYFLCDFSVRLRHVESVVRTPQPEVDRADRAFERWLKSIGTSHEGDLFEAYRLIRSAAIAAQGIASAKDV